MESIRTIIATGNKKDLFMLGLGVQSFLTLILLVSSLIVSGTPNNGFNCVLTGLLNAGLIGGSYHVIKNSRSPIAVSSFVSCCHFV
jgi:hypothetical protein